MKRKYFKWEKEVKEFILESFLYHKGQYFEIRKSVYISNDGIKKKMFEVISLESGEVVFESPYKKVVFKNAEKYLSSKGYSVENKEMSKYYKKMSKEDRESFNHFEKICDMENELIDMGYKNTAELNNEEIESLYNEVKEK